MIFRPCFTYDVNFRLSTILDMWIDWLHPHLGISGARVLGWLSDMRNRELNNITNSELMMSIVLRLSILEVMWLVVPLSGYQFRHPQKHEMIFPVKPIWEWSSWVVLMSTDLACSNMHPRSLTRDLMDLESLRSETGFKTLFDFNFLIPIMLWWKLINLNRAQNFVWF